MRFSGPISVRWPMYRLRQSASFLMLCRVEPLVHLRSAEVLSPVYPSRTAQRAATRISPFSESSVLCQ
jgi:hypothetical protein